MKAKLADLLMTAHVRKATGLRITVNSPVELFFGEERRSLNIGRVSAEDIDEMLRKQFGELVYRKLRSSSSFAGELEVDGVGRIHVATSRGVASFTFPMVATPASVTPLRMAADHELRDATPGSSLGTARKIIFGWLVPGFFITIGTVTIYGTYADYTVGVESFGWPNTPGTILKSEIYKSAGTRGKSGAGASYTYHATVSYQFSVDGKRRTGSRVSLDDYGTDDPSHAQDIIERYPAGKAVAVYHKPGDPEVSVLERGRREYFWLSYGTLGALAFFLGAVLWLHLPNLMLQQRRSN